MYTLPLPTVSGSAQAPLRWHSQQLFPAFNNVSFCSKSNNRSLFSFSYCVKNCFNTSAHKWQKKDPGSHFIGLFKTLNHPQGKKTAGMWSVIIWLGGFFHVLSTRLSVLWRSHMGYVQSNICASAAYMLLTLCSFLTIFVNVYLFPPIPNILKHSPCPPQSEALRGHRLHLLVQTRLLARIRSRQR